MGVGFSLCAFVFDIASIFTFVLFLFLPSRGQHGDCLQRLRRVRYALAVRYSFKYVATDTMNYFSALDLFREVEGHGHGDRQTSAANPRNGGHQREDWLSLPHPAQNSLHRVLLGTIETQFRMKPTAGPRWKGSTHAPSNDTCCG